MHDDTELDQIGRAIQEVAPGETSEAAFASVLADARVKARGAHRTTGGARVLRLALAAAVVVAIGAAGVSAGVQLQSRTAFAKERALAAITPRAGYVIHAKTRNWVKNAGDKKWIEDGSQQVTEFWLDLSGDRERTVTRDASGVVVTEMVSDGKRYRITGPDNPTYRGRRLIDEAYVNGHAGAVTLGEYQYVRSAMPEGQEVRSVTHNGEPYWDVRWKNVKDSYGLKLSARALFRKSDYAPALIEFNYPGGSLGRWEVLAWDAVPVSTLPTDTFSLASIPSSPSIPEERVWYAADLPKHVDYPVYWIGAKIGGAVITGTDPAPNDGARPWFIEQLGASFLPADNVLGDSCTLAEYTAADGKVATVTVASGRPMARKALSTALAKAAGGGKSAECTSALGAGARVTLPDGSALLGFALPDVTVLVQTTDQVALKQALATLRRVE